MLCVTPGEINVGIPRIKGIPPTVQSNFTNLIDPKNITNLIKPKNIINLTKPKNFSDDLINEANLNNLQVIIPKNYEQNELTPRTPMHIPTFKKNSETPIPETPPSARLIISPSPEVFRQISAPEIYIDLSKEETKKIKFSNTSLISSQYISKINLDSSKTKKSKHKVNVIYPIFEKCSLLTTDEFWIDLFTKASIGKFKRGFSFKDNYLIFNKNKDKIYLDIDPVLAFNQCAYFFKTKAGIQSEADKKMDQKIIEEKMAEMQKNIQYTWSDFKKNKTKELFINEYINALVQKYNLNTNQKMQLKHIVNYGIVIGYFSSSNIIFVDTHIQNIEGLLFDATTKIFSISPLCVPKKKTASKSIKKNNIVPIFSGKYISLTEKWNKFLQHFDNKLNKHDFNEKFEKSSSTLPSKHQNSNDS